MELKINALKIPGAIISLLMAGFTIKRSAHFQKCLLKMDKPPCLIIAPS